MCGYLGSVEANISHLQAEDTYSYSYLEVPKFMGNMQQIHTKYNAYRSLREMYGKFISNIMKYHTLQGKCVAN